MSDAEIIEAMAGGARIIVTGGRGYDGDEYELRGPGVPLTQSDIIPLLDKGWIYSSNTAYFLSDEGMKAYLRSIDEMGDGKLVDPKGESQ